MITIKKKEYLVDELINLITETDEESGYEIIKEKSEKFIEDVLSTLKEQFQDAMLCNKITKEEEKTLVNLMNKVLDV